MATEHMDSENVAANEWDQPLYIAYHRTDRKATVTVKNIEHALTCNYDMLTCSITNDHFHSRVLALLAGHNSDGPKTGLVIPPLTNLDTDLSPGEVAHRIVAYTSRWIDICSRDPTISDLSRQTLALEVAYAAFCGVEYLVIAGPRVCGDMSSLHGLSSYARAIQDALAAGPHLNLLLQISLTQDAKDEADSDKLGIGHLADHARSETSVLGQRSDNAEHIATDRPDHDTFGSWECWHTVRSFCNYSSRLLIALSIPAAKVLAEHPKAVLSRIEDRWYSEPVKAMSFCPDSFVEASKRGNPTLSHDIQALFSRLLRVKLGPWIILEDAAPLPPLEDIEFDEMGKIQVKGFKDKLPKASKSPTPAESSKADGNSDTRAWPFLHLDYIRSLQTKQAPRSVVERYGAGYQDYLQIPLQPLTDNLESATYEVFEKDPVKYELYEEALRKALRDWRDKKRPVSGQGGRVVVAVAGAGRGPLVSRAINASEAEGVPIDIWAVEKNPNAYVHLQKNNASIWSGRVTIERSDMRSWKGPWRIENAPTRGAVPPPGLEVNVFASDADKRKYYPVDILVSELLGSFGDNELSPECLDGVLHLLAANGISIPRSYTAYLTPIAAPKLHADLLSRLAWESTAFDTPAVVWLHAIDYLSTSSRGTSKSKATLPNVQKAWSFHHEPGTSSTVPSSNNHNTRFARLDFNFSNRAVCHGFGGYFESVLYPGVELSTHPNTMEQKSQAMISWFPIFFPLKTPTYVPDSSTLSISMWRQTDGRKVWYEWLVESWIRYGQDRSSSVARLGVSDLHSSIKNGCMM